MNHRAGIYVELELKHKSLSQTFIGKRAQEKSCHKLEQDPGFLRKTRTNGIRS